MSNNTSYEIRPFNKRFGQAIDFIKEKYSVSEKKIAEVIGISGSSINALKKGKSKSASKQTLMLLEAEFNINKDWLSSGNGSMGIKSDNLSDSSEEKPFSRSGISGNNLVSELYERLILEKDRYISALEREHSFLSEQVQSLKLKVDELSK